MKIYNDMGGRKKKKTGVFKLVESEKCWKGTCGYGIDGKMFGEEPYPNCVKKKGKERVKTCGYGRCQDW